MNLFLLVVPEDAPVERVVNGRRFVCHNVNLNGKQGIALGMSSHKISKITIFGHKRIKAKLCHKIWLFHETDLNIGSTLNRFIFLKKIINLMPFYFKNQENDSCEPVTKKMLESVQYNFVQKTRQQNAFHITSHFRLKFPTIIVLFWLTAKTAESAENFKLKWLATLKALCYLIF